MTDEEKAKEITIEYFQITEYCFENLLPNKNFVYNFYKGVLNGLAEGRKETKNQWHDLREDPDDLPKESGEFWTKWEDGAYSTAHYFADSGFGSYVIAWCELPEFKE